VTRFSPEQILPLRKFRRGTFCKCRIQISQPGVCPGVLPPDSKLLSKGKFLGEALEYRYWQLPNRRGYRLQWSDAGTFDVNPRARIIAVFPLKMARASALEEVLRGPVASFLFLEQGFEPLHASAVIWRGRCLAFAGPPGAGKSSLCAYFQKQGGTFFSDDILPLRRTRSGVRAHAGLPQLRLSPKSARALGMQRGVAAREKVTIAMRAGGKKPQKLAGIYFLQRRQGIQGNVHRRQLKGAESFRRLVSCTRNQAQTAGWRMQNQLRTLSWIATHVPLWILRYPSRFSAWDEIRDLLLQD